MVDDHDVGRFRVASRSLKEAGTASPCGAFEGSLCRHGVPARRYIRRTKIKLAAVAGPGFGKPPGCLSDHPGLHFVEVWRPASDAPALVAQVVGPSL